MKLVRAPPASGTDEEIPALIAALHESAQRLEELTGGEVDSVADRDGRTFLLRHAQEHLRVHEAARQAAILDALPAHTALLGGEGRIVSVNEGWRLFDGGNSALSPGYGVDTNYLEILDAVSGVEALDARRAAEGIRAVLNGGEKRFSIEYPCHSKTRDRWFLMIATPLVDDSGTSAAVMHLDITAQRRGEQSLRRLGAALDVIEDAVYLVDRASMKFVHINETACRMQSRTREEMYALGPEGILSVSLAELEHTYDAMIASGVDAEPLELLRPRKDAPDAWVELRRHAVRSGDRWTIVTLVRDITEQVARRGQLLRFRAAMDFSGDAILLIDRASLRYVDVNRTFCEMVGRTREELLGMTPMDVFSADRETLSRDYDALIAAGNGAADTFEGEYRHKDGSTIPIETRRSAMHTDQGWLIVATARDVTDRKEAERRIRYLNRVYAVLSGINALIVRVRDRDELYAEACRVLVEDGKFHGAWIGIAEPATGKIVLRASTGVTTGTQSAISQRLSVAGELPFGTTQSAQALRERRAIISNNVATDATFALGSLHAATGVRSSAILPLIVAGEPFGVLALYAREADFFQAEELPLVTEMAGNIAFALDRLDKQGRLDYLAYYDALTGLANRRLFLERVAQYMRSAARDGHEVAVFLIDLERFKNINDSLGRPTGDALLKQVAQWLKSNTGDPDLLARIGADQFALVVPVVRRDGNVAHLIDKTMAAFLGHSFVLGDTVLRLALKVGVALYPADGADTDTLFRNAEAALKKAKAGGDRYLFHTRKMTEAAAGRLLLENQLREALDKEQFDLHYQPKVSLVGGMVTGVEALIRWNDPRTGLVPPGRFIPILEETGMINEVGRWALRRAIRDYLRWRAAGLAAVRIAVNVSPLQLRNRGFIAEIEQVIGIDPQAAAGLELEITESLIMADVTLSIASLQAIRALGVSIAIDDFGTGFSSLAYLAKLPVDTLKIDRSFVIDMTSGPQGLALVSTIINLAHSLKLKVVAEGVETEEQSRLLRLLGCDQMQGFLFSRPLPAAEFESRFLLPPGPA